MFYCEPCRLKNEWPESFGFSRGQCEVCEKYDICHSRASSTLPMPKRKITEAQAATVPSIQQRHEAAVKFCKQALEDSDGHAYAALQVLNILEGKEVGDG